MPGVRLPSSFFYFCPPCLGKPQNRTDFWQIRYLSQGCHFTHELFSSWSLFTWFSQITMLSANGRGLCMHMKREGSWICMTFWDAAMLDRGLTDELLCFGNVETLVGLYADCWLSKSSYGNCLVHTVVRSLEITWPPYSRLWHMLLWQTPWRTRGRRGTVKRRWRLWQIKPHSHLASVSQSWFEFSRDLLAQMLLLDWTRATPLQRALAESALLRLLYLGVHPSR